MINICLMININAPLNAVGDTKLYINCNPEYTFSPRVKHRI